MATQKQRRLGRGLSSLIGTQNPIHVEPTPQIPHKNQTTMGGAQGGVVGSLPAVPEGDRTGNRHGGAGHGELVQWIAVGEIEPSRFQPRRHFDEESLAQLAASITHSGVMQPVLVRPVSDGRGGGYELIAGERRWRAAHQAGLTQIPAIVRDLVDREAAEWALVENMQREDLDPIERAHGLRGLVERFGLSHAELGARIGLDRSTIANLIRLTELEEPIQALVSAGQLAMGHARAIASMPAGAARIDLATRAAKAGWSVRQVEHHVRQHAQPEVPPKEVSNKTPTQREAVIADIERRLGEHLGTKTKITLRSNGNRGCIQIEFFSLEQFEGLMDRIGLRDEDA